MAKKKKNDSAWRSTFFYFLLLLIALSLFAPFFSAPRNVAEVNFSDFLNQVDQGKISQITVKGDIVEGKYNDGKAFRTRALNYPNLVQNLREKGVSIKVEEPADSSWFFNLFVQILLPLLFFVGLWFLIMRQAQGVNSQAMSFGMYKGKAVTSKAEVTFKDVAGVDEAKEELEEIVDFLKHPEKFRALGARIPRGLLLVGAPGTGKTLLARAIAGEAGVPFFSLSGSDFVEMFVGVGASVTGDTPVLVRDKEKTRLIPISEFVDNYYDQDQQGYPIKIEGIETLGFQGKNSSQYSSEDKFFGGSAWKKVDAVYRHKVEKIYEIHYLGGTIRTTGDHSIFVRDKNRLKIKKASELKIGDKLVNLPYKVRGKFLKGLGTFHHVRAHSFPQEIELELEMWDELPQWFNKYTYAVASQGKMATQEVASNVGVSSTTILNWQKEICSPEYLARRLKYPNLPEKILLTPDLLKLFGYYTAEGRAGGYLEFIFGSHEKDHISEIITLMKSIFHCEPKLEDTPDNSTRIKYYFAPLAHFFRRYCGTGSANKHVPDFIWDLPYKYFLAYLEGWGNGDGYITQEKKLSITSVSHQLILEMNWLCAMHGIKAGIRSGKNKCGRILKNRPLPETNYWNLIIGKTANPFTDENIDCPDQMKKPYVKKIVIKDYDGFVYDLCGCENEAFFGGEKPILLHNSRVRSLFNQAKKQAPAIIFMDEIDAVGRHRGAGLGGGHDEREQTLNQLLVEMDGFDANTNIIIIAATNRPDILDPALLRPGRFDRTITIDKPDIKGRRAILDIHAKGKPLGKDIDLEIIARRTPGFTGADLANIMNESAILAARCNKKEINMPEAEEAVDRVMAGPQKKSRVMQDKEKKVIAYHEVGHALLSKLLPNVDSVHKISVLPRGMALGYTLQLPEQDKHLLSKSEATEQIVVLLGGRVAEEIVFGEITSGAQNDLERATAMAKKMVCEMGMSSLGLRTFGHRDRQVFLGRDFGETKDYGDLTADAIDKEINSIINDCYHRAKEILSKNRSQMDEVATLLMEKETLEGGNLAEVLKSLMV